MPRRESYFLVMTPVPTCTGVQHILPNSLLWELASTNPQSERDALILVESILKQQSKSEAYFGSPGTRKDKLEVVLSL